MSSSRASLVAFLILVIVVSLGSTLLLLSQPNLLPKMRSQLESFRPKPIHITIHPPPPTATPAPTATPRPIMVYVTGEVARRGTKHILPHGSRVSDAIAAAGGFTELANRERVNLAGILRDGDQVHVPSSEANRLDEALPTASGGSLVNVNTATLEDLDTLPNIGPVTAQNIIDFREGVGPFSELADLDDVPGIGPSTLEKLEEWVRFD